MASFYSTAEWQRARRVALIEAGWKCARCGTSLAGKGKGAHVHHRRGLEKAPALRAEPLNLQALCVGCHNAIHAEMKQPATGGCTVSGSHTDPAHPWYGA